MLVEGEADAGDTSGHCTGPERARKAAPAHANPGALAHANPGALAHANPGALTHANRPPWTYVVALVAADVAAGPSRAPPTRTRAYAATGPTGGDAVASEPPPAPTDPRADSIAEASSIQPANDCGAWIPTVTRPVIGCDPTSTQSSTRVHPALIVPITMASGTGLCPRAVPECFQTLRRTRDDLVA